MDKTSERPATDVDNADGTATATAQSCGDLRAAPCPACGSRTSAQARSYVYALGRIEPRFPTPGVEKEFAQVAGRENGAGLTDHQLMTTLLGKREHRYLARDLCWVFSIEGLETYLLTPRDPGDIDVLVEALRPEPNPTDMDLVVGVQGPVAPPEMCNGLMLPIVQFDQIYSFDRNALIDSIPRPEDIGAKEYATSAAEVLDRIMQMADNAGATDEHRALNYLAVRYPAIYSLVAESFGRNLSFCAVEVRPSSLSGIRRVVDVIFSFNNRNTDVTEKYFVRVDVTEKFPYLVTKLSTYLDR
jgi:hypothetical protein